LKNRFFPFTIFALFASFLAQAQVCGQPVYGPKVYVPGQDAAHAALVQMAAELGTGKWWIRLSDEAKDRFVERYTKAMNHISSDLSKDCANGAKSLPPVGAQQADVLSNMLVCKTGSSFDFNFDLKEIMEAVNKFYEDSANLTVSIDIALQRVRETLAAKHRGTGCGIG
jgi:hypothetical protein